MPKVISFFNHKGGVGKTTNAFHIASKISSLGKKVLLVDLDPQCNLTGLTQGIEDYLSLSNLYTSKDSNVYDCLKDFFVGNTTSIIPANIIPTKSNPNLWIIPGHIDVALFDDEIATATKISKDGGIRRLAPLVGMFYKLIEQTSKKNAIDIVCIDMSPSISATNMSILMGSDYFIVPTAPDFFSYQAIDSLSRVLPTWPDELAFFKDDVFLPRKNPKMLGVLHQNFRVYSGDMTSTFKEWSTKIDAKVNSHLVAGLSSKNMIIDEAKFLDGIKRGHSPYNLGYIQNYNTLIPKSQFYSKPVFNLSDSELGWTGAVLSQAKAQIKDADSIYTDISQSIMEMTS